MSQNQLPNLDMKAAQCPMASQFQNLSPKSLREAAERGGCPFAGSITNVPEIHPPNSESKKKPSSPGRTNSSVDDHTSNALARLVVDSMPDAVLIATGEGNIVQVNDATIKMFGYRRRELINTNLKILMPDAVAARHDEYMSRFVEKVNAGKAQLEEGSQVGKLRELRGKRKDNSTFPVEVVISPIQDPIEDGALLIAGYIRDITERKAALQAKQERDHQQALRRMSEHLLGYINHEIRNPLHGMRGFIDLINDELNAIVKSGKTPQMEKVAQLRRDIKNLNELTGMLGHIVNDVLDLRKVEEGKLPLDIGAASINGVAEKACHVLRPKILEKQDVEFKFKPLAQDHTVEVDSHRVTQIIVNLLSNAIKYTDKGSIVVSVASYKQDGSDSTPQNEHTHIRVSVADTGRGISEEHKRFIFQPYQQVFASETKLFGGTGLGLHLCQEIARVMHGAVRFESQEGRGSTFYFEFPIHSPDKKVIASVGSVPNTQIDIDNFKSHHSFLVVDDVALNRSILRRVLKSFGASSVVEACNGDEAIKEMVKAQGKFDVVFMDSVMPIKGGLEATRELRTLGYTVPVIGLTGNVSEESTEVAVNAGMFSVVEKPCSKLRIAQCLNQLNLNSQE